MTASTRAVQERLRALGYDPGPADGIMGRKTIGAVTRFQEDRRLGIRFPGTVGPKTIAALGLDVVPPEEPVWIDEARRWLGKHERLDGKELDKALRLDASETPWCGAYVRAVVAAALPHEVLPSNPLGARNWLAFGRALDAPQVGAVAVFWRGRREGWQGHVGFAVGHDASHLHVLGGNQGDRVSIARIAKGRLLGLRYPLTGGDPPAAPLPTSTIKASITTNEA